MLEVKNLCVYAQFARGEELYCIATFRQYNFGQARQGGAAASFGQLVRLGFDVTVFTPASYQRHRL